MTTKHCTFYIEITNEHQLKCSYLPQEENEETNKIIIQLTQNIDFYPITISFENNKPIICQERENNISFFNDLNQTSNEFKEYKINIRNKEYSFIAEILFGFIVKEFKKQIDKEWIIDETIVSVSNKDHRFAERIMNSLEIIGFKNIHLESFTYDYSEQIERFEEVNQEIEEYNKYSKQLERAKEIVSEEKKKLLEINQTQKIGEEEIYKIG